VAACASELGFGSETLTYSFTPSCQNKNEYTAGGPLKPGFGLSGPPFGESQASNPTVQSSVVPTLCKKRKGSGTRRPFQIPTSRKGREKWGTPCVADVGEIKSQGPPTLTRTPELWIVAYPLLTGLICRARLMRLRRIIVDRGA
jgi:hypothetical protein